MGNGFTKLHSSFSNNKEVEQILNRQIFKFAFSFCPTNADFMEIKLNQNSF
jgi:hypothetical protein